MLPLWDSSPEDAIMSRGPPGAMLTRKNTIKVIPRKTGIAISSLLIVYLITLFTSLFLLNDDFLLLLLSACHVNCSLLSRMCRPVSLSAADRLTFIPIHANSYSNISNCVCQYRIIIEFFVDFFMYKFMNFHLTKPTKAIMISL